MGSLDQLLSQQVNLYLIDNLILLELLMCALSTLRITIISARTAYAAELKTSMTDEDEEVSRTPPLCFNDGHYSMENVYCWRTPS